MREHVVTMGDMKSKTEIISELWNNVSNHSLTCPKCGGHLIIMQLDPIEDMENPYTPYESILECMNCSFQTTATSFTILGSVQSFDLHHLTLVGWSPSGSRVETTYEHILDYDHIKQLQTSEKLAEFLIVDDHIVQIIK